MEIVTKILPIALAFIMLTLGLSLTTQDFIRVIKQPKDFLLGMFSQILILPFVAILLITNLLPSLIEYIISASPISEIFAVLEFISTL